MKNKVLLLFITTLLCACADSPADKGKETAEKYNSIITEFNTKISDAEKTITDNINKGKYTTRVAARNEYNTLVKESIEKLDAELTEHKINIEEIKFNYKQDIQKINLFTFSYKEVVKEVNIELLKKNALLNNNINQQIATIIPSKPDLEKVQNDLIKRTIADNDDSYGTRKVKGEWTILATDIKEFELLNMREENDEVVYELRLLLQRKGSAVNVKSTIRYSLGEQDDWFIRLLSVDEFKVVETGNYNDYIGWTWEKQWFVIPGISINNRADIALYVEGKYFDNNKWKKFNAIINGNESEFIELGWNANKVEIETVEIPY